MRKKSWKILENSKRFCFTQNYFEMDKLITNDWKQILKHELESEYFIEIKNRLQQV